MPKQLNKIFDILQRIDENYHNYALLNENLILEAMSISDVHEKYYNQIPEEEFKMIVFADPTAKEDKMGKYSKWLLALYTGGNLKLEDLYKATDYLITFHKYKNKLEKKDIGQYKSLPELYDAIQPYEDNTQAASHKEEIRQIKKGAEKVYEDNEWLVIVPYTEETAIFYGKGTQWCTAATQSDNYFDYYNDNDYTLYININKQTGEKYQFCLESGEFMNERDAEEIPKVNDNLFNFYYNIYKQKENRYRASDKKILRLKYDEVYKFWFDSESNINRGLLMVKRDGLYNFIDEKDETFEEKSDIWFDEIYAPFNEEGFTVVEKGDMFNIIDVNGNLVLNDWYSMIYKDHEKNGPSSKFNFLAQSEDGKKWVPLNERGELISDLNMTFEECPKAITLYGPSKKYGYIVKVNGKYTVVDKDFKETMLDGLYDDIDCYSYFPILHIKNNGKMAAFNIPERIMSDWYDNIGSFSIYRSAILAIVILDNKRNLMDTDCRLRLDRWYDTEEKVEYATAVNNLLKRVEKSFE